MDLSRLGFSKNEEKVYLSLFELGKTRAGKVIEHTSLHRNLVYTALEALLGRDLITKTLQKGVSMFSANNPDKLIEEIENKKNQAVAVAEELKKKVNLQSREVVIFEGVDGIERAIRQNIQSQKGKTVFALGTFTNSVLSESQIFSKKYHNELTKKGISFKALYGRNIEDDVVEEKNKLSNTEARYMPTSIEAPVWFNICGDVSSIISMDKNPLAINIKSESIAEGLKQYFKHLWNQKVMTLEGDRGFKHAFGDILKTLHKGDELIVMGIPEFDQDFVNMIKDFHTKRSGQGITSRILLNEQAKDMGEALRKIKHTKIKYMQRGVVTPAALLIYKNKTLISLPSRRTFMQIDDKETAESFMYYFNELWGDQSRLWRDHAKSSFR